MANIQNLYVVKAEDGSIVNAITSYDLSTIVGGQEVPKQVEAKYVVNNGGTYLEYTYPAKGSKYLTKVTNQATGEFAYLDEPKGKVSSLLTNPSCNACIDEIPTQSVEITSSCEKPVFVKVCDINQRDCELIITDPIDLCVKICTSTTQTGDCAINACLYESWVMRERIVWNSVDCVEVSKVVEYSKDGVTWQTTAPENVTLGECPEIEVEPIIPCSSSISEAFGNDLSTLLPSNNFSITKPSCCKILVETSIGNFHVLQGVQFYNTSDFKCEVVINNVSIVDGNCTLDQIHIIGNKI